MYPENIVINGITYSVFVSRGDDEQIEYFQLRYPDGEFFFECDWEGDFDEDDVRGLLRESGEIAPIH